MPAERLMPTLESADLLELTAKSPTRNWPRGPPRRSRSASPARCSARWAVRACSAFPTRRRTAAAGSPTRSTCRSSRSSPGVGGGRRRGQRAHAVLLRAVPVRHRGAAQRWLPEMLGGELLGAYCLSEPARGSDAAAMRTRRGPRRRRLRHGRHQGVGHPRRRGRLLHRLGPHRRDGGRKASPASWWTPTRRAWRGRPSTRWA